jgi:hypothetical protein
MEIVSVELYTDQKNGAVLKLPNRQFPGVLIQGDSLRGLIEDLGEVLEECGTVPGSEGVREGVQYVLERLEFLRQRYDEAMSEKNANQSDEHQSGTQIK